MHWINVIKDNHQHVLCIITMIMFLIAFTTKHCCPSKQPHRAAIMASGS